MLIEARKIIFPPETLGEILLDFCHNEGVNIPNSQLQHVKIGNTNRESVVMQFITANPKQPAEVPLNEAFVLSAMINGCKKYRVPIPRAADKTVTKTNQGLAMQIVLKVSCP